MKIITCRQSFLRCSMVFVLEFLRKLLCMNLCAVWEHCLVGKKPPLGIFLDIVGAFDNVTFRSFDATLRGLGMSKILTSWIETLLRHSTVQVELYGYKIKREVVKGNPQGGILSPFLWNCVLNS